MNGFGQLGCLLVLASAAATALTLPAWRAWCRRSGLVDDPGPRKIHARPVPLAGGLAIGTGILATLIGFAAALQFGVAGAGMGDHFHRAFAGRAWTNGVALAGAFGLLLVGWFDDRRELRPAIKFRGQFLVAVLVAAGGIRPDGLAPVPGFVLAVLWMLTVTNACNFLDNMNGLCAGVGAIGAGWLAVLAARQDEWWLAVPALVLGGALVGFLPFNFPRATAFLGDAGSHLVGGSLAVLTLLPFVPAPTPAAPGPWMAPAPLFVLAVPLVDLAWVVAWRGWHRRPIYVGDTNHLSHQLVRRGLSETQAVLVLWLAAAAAGALALRWQ